MGARELRTRRGAIRLPCFVPVTTFGGRYPLDDLIRPYLPRLASAAIVSYHYARQASDDELPQLPLFVDSGGFVSLFERATIHMVDGLGAIDISGDAGTDRIHPRDVLDLQERIGDVAFTLDFPIPPGIGRAEAERRQRLTLLNAEWAMANRRRRDLVLFGCVQGWDVTSMTSCAKVLRLMGFDGLAVGGLVPRAADRQLVQAIVEGVRAQAGDLPVHVFGLGNPELVDLVIRAGADSVDSSSFVKLAADGRLWGRPGVIPDPSPTDRLHIALCNLAMATQSAMPLSAASLVFRTHLLRTQPEAP